MTPISWTLRNALSLRLLPDVSSATPPIRYRLVQNHRTNQCAGNTSDISVSRSRHLLVLYFHKILWCFLVIYFMCFFQTRKAVRAILHDLWAHDPALHLARMELCVTEAFTLAQAVYSSLQTVYKHSTSQLTAHRTMMETESPSTIKSTVQSVFGVCRRK